MLGTTTSHFLSSTATLHLSSPSVNNSQLPDDIFVGMCLSKDSVSFSNVAKQITTLLVPQRCALLAPYDCAASSTATTVFTRIMTGSSSEEDEHITFDVSEPQDSESIDPGGQEDQETKSKRAKEESGDESDEDDPLVRCVNEIF